MSGKKSNEGGPADESARQPMAANKNVSLKNEQGQEVELFVEGKDLVDLDFFSVSDPICTLKTRESNLKHATWQFNDETEVIDNNLNPRWNKHFSVWFIFIRDIDLWFQVWNFNSPTEKDLIGECEINLSQLMLAPQQEMTITLKLIEKPGDTKQLKNRENRGKLIVRADKIRKTQDLIKFQISADLKSKKFLCFGSDEPLLQIERHRQIESADWIKVWNSPTASEEIRPSWDATQLLMTEFCNNDKFLPMKFTVINNQRNSSTADNQKIYGFVETTTRDIEMAVTNNEPLLIKNADGQVKGKLIFNQFQMDMRPSLLDYLSLGWQMQVTIAVDFTLSNLEITDVNSLHRQMQHGAMNQYEKAIFEVCNVMCKYGKDGCFNVYGFGGIPHYMGYRNQVSRLWNLNGSEDPRCLGTMEVLNAYQKGIIGTTLAGPSYFGKLLETVEKQIDDSLNETGLDGNRLYHVVIIITDGNCHDMPETTTKLVELSKMPFSAVVIGVGDGDFEDMEILDADGEVLQDPNGDAAIRDVVQLVQYADFAELGQRELALSVLGELPDQFVDYMVMKDNDPSKIYHPTNYREPDAAPGEEQLLASDRDDEEEVKMEEEEYKPVMKNGGLDKIQLIKIDDDQSHQVLGKYSEAALPGT